MFDGAGVVSRAKLDLEAVRRHQFVEFDDKAIRGDLPPLGRFLDFGIEHAGRIQATAFGGDPVARSVRIIQARDQIGCVVANFLGVDPIRFGGKGGTVEKMVIGNGP